MSQRHLKFATKHATIEEDEETIRPKSTGGQNRKYCINKLFKKATGLGIAEYKKSEEYRLPVHGRPQRPASSVTSPQGGPPKISQEMRNSSSLRVKSRSISSRGASNKVIRNSEQERSRSRKEESFSAPLSHIKSETKASKIQRYKMVERELEYQRDLERARELEKEQERLLQQRELEFQV